MVNYDDKLAILYPFNITLHDSKNISQKNYD